ncbi:hypothetical protein ACQUY5_18600 [Bacillus cereus]|uniref:hypothetical protein n=1 Tax=Bacillus cereus TaxID=1396 RepID=UPI003D16999F
MLTMKQAIVKEIGVQWGIVLEKGSYELKNIKIILENRILKEAKEETAKQRGTELVNSIQASDIKESVLEKAIEDLNLQQLKISDLADKVAKEHETFEHKHLYTVCHKVVSESEGLLVKEKPGYIQLNKRFLSVEGVSRHVSKTSEMLNYLSHLKDTQESLQELIELVNNEENPVIFGNVDSDWLLEQLELVSKLKVSTESYQIKKRLSK